MESKLNWLDEVVVVNESTDERLPGDLSIYRSEGDACSYLEPWWVEKNEGFAFSASGLRLILGLGHAGEVIVARREECAEGPEIVLGWLQALAQTTLQARNRVAQNGRAILSRAEEEGALPDTVEGLVAYISFPWVAPRDWLIPSCLLLLASIAALLIYLLIKVI